MKSKLAKLFNFLASVKLTIFLLTSIAAVLLLQAAGTKLLTVLNGADSADLFLSRFGIILLILFSINLSACCIKHLQKTILDYKKDINPIDEDLPRCLPVVESFTLKDFDETIKKVSKALSINFKKPVFNKKNSDRCFFYAEKGKHTPLGGFYLAHLSMLFIVLGVILSTQGFHYTFYMAKGQVMDPLIVVDSSKKKRVLDFSLLCEDFKTIYRENSRSVKKHQSTLSIIKSGKKIKTRTVEFGHALSHNGIDIYQNRFSKKIKHARIKVMQKHGLEHIYEVRGGEIFTLNASGIKIRAVGFKPKTVQLISINPRARLWISRNSSKFSKPEFKDYTFSLLGFSHKEMTGLKIIGDPGKPFVWYGFLIMIAGFSIMFFCSKKRVWAKIEKKQDGCLVTLYSTGAKEILFFREKIDSA